MGIFNPFNPFLSSFLPASFLKQQNLKQEEPEPSGSTGSSVPDPEPLNLVIPKKQEAEEQDDVNYDNVDIDKTYEMKHNKPKQRNYKVW